MQTTVLGAHPRAGLSVFVIWVPVLATDSIENARTTVNLIDDPRAVHYYDEKREAGHAIAEAVGGTEAIAWDCYLFFRAGVMWDKVLPTPDRWMHQLGPSVWADPTRFRWRDSLTAELRSAAAVLLGATEGP
ncbi:MAG TPA: hypothetical protein VI007_00395 [bacterium]